MSISNRFSARIFSSCLAASAAVVTLSPSAASANNPCTSEWVKFKSFFDQNGAKIARGICMLSNKDDAAAAKKCADDFDRVKAQIDQKLAEYNAKADDSQWKIGPRGLGEGQWATGTLLAQRTFAGAPILSDTYRLELQRTGGKATNQLKATVCFLDSDGKLAQAPVNFSVDKNSASYANTFNGVAGLTPVILLEKPAGVNGHQYQIRGARGAEPEVVREARVIAGNADAKAAKMRGGQ